MGYFAHGVPRSYRHPWKRHPNYVPELLTANGRTSVAEGHRGSSNYAHDGNGRVRHIVPDPSGKYVLTVTPAALYVWSAQQHRVLQGRFLIGANALIEEGSLVCACWAPTSDTVVAAFENGLVLFFSLQETASVERSNCAGLLDFNIHDEGPSHLSAPGTVLPVVLQRIAETRLAHSPAVITTTCACPAGALFGTSAGHLTCMSWDAEMLWRVHVPELLRCDDTLLKMGVYQPSAVEHAGSADGLKVITTPLEDDSAGGVIAINYSGAVDFCGIILGCGAAFLLSVRRRGFLIPSAMDGRWLRSEGSSCITIEPQRMLATVGLQNGDVEQFYFGVPAGDVCPVMRRLSLSSWYFEPEDVGAACVVSWTHDGCALVVGWEKRGLAVWSVSGCRLMWTLPQVGGALPSTPAIPTDSTAHTSNALDEGVSSAAWGPEGLYLLAAPRATSSSTSLVMDCHFLEFSFFKNTCGVNTCQSEASRLAMLGSDRVLLLRSYGGSIEHVKHASRNHEHSEACTKNGQCDEYFAWQHIQVPHDYLWRSWPLKRVAVSDDVTHVAVAGAHGLAMCALRTQKWRIFGDKSQSGPHIECCALVWAGSSIVVGNLIRSFSRGKYVISYELLVFARDHADLSVAQAHRALPARPIIIDFRVDGFLLVICENSSIVLLKLSCLTGPTIELKEMYQTFLPTRESRAIAAPSPSVLNGGDTNGKKYEDRRQEVPASENLFDRRGKRTESSELPVPGGGIVVARIFPPMDHSGKYRNSHGNGGPVPTQIMLLRSTGSLILLDVRQMMSVPLLRYVEHFWYTSVSEPPFDSLSNRPVWWAYGDDGIHVCFREGMRRYMISQEDGASLNDSQLDVSGAERLASMSPLEAVVPERLRSSASSRSSGIGVEQWFELDPEVYPLGVLSKHGMVLGVCQGLMLDARSIDAEATPSHVIQVKLQPVLHTLLRHLLLKSESEDRVALQVAFNSVNQPQFVDSLEWLLYEAVIEYDDEGDASNVSNPVANGIASSAFDSPEYRLVDGLPSSMTQFTRRNSRDSASFPASPRRRRAGSRLFPRVIKMLKYFGEYEDVVVRCARKMESKSWPLLFSLAGEPVSLLEQCFSSGRLRTAACLLVILQEMWGFAASTSHSLKLISAAISRGELSLAGDLANFLGKASKAGILDATQLQAAEDVSWIAESAKPLQSSENSLAHPPSIGNVSNSRIPAVDYAVLRYAKMLLRDLEFRNLVALSVRMDFPLATWLKRMRLTEGQIGVFGVLNDLGLTLLRLHQQFQYPEPSEAAVSRAIRGCTRTIAESERSGTEDDVASNLSRMSLSIAVLEQPIGGCLKSPRFAESPRAFAERTHVKMFGSGADNQFGSQLPPPPSSNDSLALTEIRAKARHLCRQELLYLQSVAQSAEAHDLSAVFSILLLDIVAVVRSLRRDKRLGEPILQVLRSFDVRGYDRLADGIESIVADSADIG